MKTYQEKYLKYKNKYINLKDSINSKNMIGGADKTLTLIKAEWCGHCRRFKSIWEELPTHIKGINFKLLDSEENKKEIEKYDILGYPSIFLEIGDKKISYEGERSIEKIKEFVENN